MVSFSRGVVHFADDSLFHSCARVAQAEVRVAEAEYERELTEERVMRAEAEAKTEARRRIAEEKDEIQNRD